MHAIDNRNLVLYCNKPVRLNTLILIREEILSFCFEEAETATLYYRFMMPGSMHTTQELYQQLKDIPKTHILNQYGAGIRCA